MIKFTKIQALSLLLFCLNCSQIKAQNTPFLDPIYSDITMNTVDYSDVFSDDFHKMDVYQATQDTHSKRPLLLYIHGGAFYAGDKATQDCIDFCTEFAKRGYVTASVNYRLANALVFLSNKTVQLDAVLKTMADVKAAIRFFNKNASQNNTYRIDSNAIFIGGYSAGGVAALHTAWVTDTSELDANLNTILKNGIKTLDGDAGNKGYTSKIKGIFSLAGALHQTSYASNGDIPVYLAHAKNDETVLFECGPGLNNPLVVNLCGTGKIYPRLDSVNVYYDTMILETGGHAWPGLGQKGADFNNAVKEIATFFYPFLLDNVRLHKKKLIHATGMLYPNPSKGNITLKLPKEVPFAEIKLYNVQGKEVFQTRCNNAESFALSLPSGLYFAKIQTPENSWNQQISIQ